MQVLIVHGQDHPLSGPWVARNWDAVYDLARSGWAACERWSAAFGCPVKPIDGLRNGFAEVTQVRQLLKVGLDQMVDEEGLDWWELTAIMVHYDLERLVLLWKLVDNLPSDAQVWITRDGFEAQVLRFRLGPRLQIVAGSKTGGRGVGHYLNRLRHLPWSHVLQTLGDKYDAGYRLRRHFHKRPKSSGKALVLLPTSYINMSRTGTEYASLLPEQEFLLVATRQSGRLAETPANVRQEWLASYAGEPSADDRAEMLERWESLRREIRLVPEFAALEQAGLMSNFEWRISVGLAVRDAWLRVLEHEQIRGVLCSDDSNPHTHIPVLLAKRRGLPTVTCHHGALDGRYLMKRVHADVILAKGRMEQDYLTNACGIDPDTVEIGASSESQDLGTRRLDHRDWIVFFSEPYEMTGGRTEEIYRDILPGLLSVAGRTKKRMVVKLHPSENLGERQHLVRQLLSHDEVGAIVWRTGGLESELLYKIWCGVTVQSSVVVECTMQGVPCFICEWLDLWPYGYVWQFRKFRIGLGLGSPEEIAQIPEMLASYVPDRGSVENSCEAVSPARLQEILTGRSEARSLKRAGPAS